jgi:hypothetical protein
MDSDSEKNSLPADETADLVAIEEDGSETVLPPGPGPLSDILAGQINS